MVHLAIMKTSVRNGNIDGPMGRMRMSQGGWKRLNEARQPHTSPLGGALTSV